MDKGEELREQHLQRLNYGTREIVKKLSPDVPERFKTSATIAAYVLQNICTGNVGKDEDKLMSRIVQSRFIYGLPLMRIWGEMYATEQDLRSKPQWYREQSLLLQKANDLRQLEAQFPPALLSWIKKMERERSQEPKSDPRDVSTVANYSNFVKGLELIDGGQFGKQYVYIPAVDAEHYARGYYARNAKLYLDGAAFSVLGGINQDQFNQIMKDVLGQKGFRLKRVDTAFSKQEGGIVIYYLDTDSAFEASRKFGEQTGITARGPAQDDRYVRVNKGATYEIEGGESNDMLHNRGIGITIPQMQGTPLQQYINDIVYNWIIFCWRLGRQPHDTYLRSFLPIKDTNNVLADYNSTKQFSNRLFQETGYEGVNLVSRPSPFS